MLCMNCGKGRATEKVLCANCSQVANAHGLKNLGVDRKASEVSALLKRMENLPSAPSILPGAIVVPHSCPPGTAPLLVESVDGNRLTLRRLQPGGRPIPMARPITTRKPHRLATAEEIAAGVKLPRAA